MENNKSMYTSFQVGNRTVKNRLIHSAIFEFGAKEGKITEEIVAFYARLAQGGAGLILTGMEAITSGGANSSAMVDTSRTDYGADMAPLLEAVHKENSLLFVQLNHAGYKTAKNPAGDRFGVCDMLVTESCAYHAATEAELAALPADFAAAALRCKEAGCDGVQIHAAHSYLLSTFLSPFTNRRTDGYGGPVENRARLLLEVYDAMRAAVGKDYPIAVKMPCVDNAEPSITTEESLWIAKALAERGIDLIEVSGGVAAPGRRTASAPLAKAGELEGNYLPWAAKIAAAVNVPVSSVCGYRTPGFIEKTLWETDIAAVSLGRPLICEPELPNRWQKDPSPAKCISCNKCFASAGFVGCQAFDR